MSAASPQAAALRSRLLGLAASSAATYVHYNLIENPDYSSFCDINATVSCKAAYLSRYGSVAGVPVAVGGVLFFAWVLLMVWGSRGKSRIQDSAPAYIFAVSTLALAVVLYLAYASFFILKEVCPLCVATYVAVIGVFVISGGASSVPMSSCLAVPCATSACWSTTPRRAGRRAALRRPAPPRRSDVLPARRTPGGAAAARRSRRTGSAQRIRALVGRAAGAVERAVRERRGEGADRGVRRLTSARSAGRPTFPTSRSSTKYKDRPKDVKYRVAPFSRSTRTATPACRSWCTLRPATRRRRR